MTDGTFDCSSADAAAASPLAQQIFAIEGIKRVFFGHDFVTVTKAPEAQWELLKPAILGCIADYFLVHEHVEIRNPKRDDGHGNELEGENAAIVKEIKDLLESRIRPAVAMDGGDITFERYEKGIVYVRMQGACAGCPSSTATLKAGIENMLRYYIPEVVEVRAASE
jgi:Fe-S cluster biogenesis protein NfuA